MAKQYIKKFANWTVPPHLQRLAVTAWRHVQRHIVTDREVAAKVKKNTRFKDIHKGEDCFILCTGPSIKNYDLLRLKGKRCIAVSFFSMHEHYKELAPDYHVFAPNHPPLEFEHAEKMFTAFKKNECPETVAFIGHMNYRYSYLNYLREHPELKPDKLEFLCYDGSPTLDEYNYNKKSVWDIARRPFIMRSVLFGTMQLAAYMGFKRIYILGADYNFLDTVNKPCNHFYEHVTDDISKNPKEYFEDVFNSLYITFHNYRLMREYLDYRNIEIINLSRESKLDMFKKQDFKNIKFTGDL